MSVSSPHDLTEPFKQAMRRLAASVTIVTAADGDAKFGMTATAVASVSIDPPSVLVCVNRLADLHARMTLGKKFCINLLGAGHDKLSATFGGKELPQNLFSNGRWHLDGDGPPILADAEVTIECAVDAMFDYSTHTIFVGKVEEIKLREEMMPLIYYGGRFIPT